MSDTFSIFQFNFPCSYIQVKRILIVNVLSDCNLSLLVLTHSLEPCSHESVYPCWEVCSSCRVDKPIEAPTRVPLRSPGYTHTGKRQASPQRTHIYMHNGRQQLSTTKRQQREQCNRKAILGDIMSSSHSSPSQEVFKLVCVLHVPGCQILF